MKANFKNYFFSNCNYVTAVHILSNGLKKKMPSFSELARGAAIGNNFLGNLMVKQLKFAKEDSKN